MLISQTHCHVLNLDKLAYASHPDALADIAANERYQFVMADISDRTKIDAIFQQFQPDVVMHLAAESHVVHSIASPAAFIQTNIVGTYTLLEAERQYCLQLEGSPKARFRFHHVSTYEVYGSLGESGLFVESSAYDPSSPYWASKVLADHLVRAWHRTYGLPVVITNCCDFYRLIRR